MSIAVVAFLHYLLLTTEPAGDYISVLSRASGPVVLAVIVVGAIKKRPWWVPGEQYRALERERNELLELALKSTHTTERVVTLAEERQQNDALHP